MERDMWGLTYSQDVQLQIVVKLSNLSCKLANTNKPLGGLAIAILLFAILLWCLFMILSVQVVPYTCCAIGSRDRSVSIWVCFLKIVISCVFVQDGFAVFQCVAVITRWV